MKIFKSIGSKMTISRLNKQRHINTPFAEEQAIQRDGYKIVNKDPWCVGKIKGVRYRIVVPMGLTDAHLIRIGNELLKGNKGCDDLTIWCFGAYEEIINYKPYTVAMIEKSKNSGQKITRREGGKWL